MSNILQEQTLCRQSHTALEFLSTPHHEDLSMSTAEQGLGKQINRRRWNRGSAGLPRRHFKWQQDTRESF